MSKNEIEDQLRPEYDLQCLQARKLGPGRNRFCDTVRLEPDVIAAFPNAEAVNEALRYLIEVAKRTNSLTQRSNAPADCADATALSFTLNLYQETGYIAAIMISVDDINCENLSCNERGVHIWVRDSVTQHFQTIGE